ncbi:MAG: SprT family zinc-dependent metalloprotease [Prochlorococcus sp.]
MPLEPLLPLFHRLNRDFFDGDLAVDSKSLTSIRWSDGRLRKTAGFYRRRPGGWASQRSEIVLSRPLLEPLPRSATESTLCHEMIHAWIDLVLGVQEGHGPQFHARMKVINAAQDTFQVSVRHQFPVPVSPPRWIAECPSCGLQMPYRRRVKGAACRVCCDQRHGGRWHASCVLSYVPASQEA